MIAESVYEAVLMNGSVVHREDLTVTIPEGASVYEVIRLMQGVPLFLKEHMDRMNHSMALAGLAGSLSYEAVCRSIRALKAHCGVSDNNIKLMAWNADGAPVWAGWFVPSSYPERSLYESGAATGLLHRERENPRAKVWNTAYKTAVAAACKEQGLFEMILVTQEGAITEGSRSNLFFATEDSLVTSPDDQVLGGITRQKLLEVLEAESIPLVRRRIASDELESFQGAFLTGTSIHVLPIRTIGDWERDSSHHPLILRVMQAFENTVGTEIDRILREEAICEA